MSAAACPTSLTSGEASTARPGTISEWMAQQTAKSPDALFLCGPESLTYRQALSEIRRMANALRNSGLKKGDRLLVVSSNRSEIPLLVFAAATAGVVFTILHEQVRPTAFRRILESCEPSLVILGTEAEELRACIDVQPVVWLGGERSPRASDPDFDAWVSRCGEDTPEDDAEEVEQSDLAFLVFTSGSTGNPRGVMLTHANVRFVCEAIQHRLGYRTSDRIGIFLPLSFDYGLYQVFYAAMCGAAIYIGTPAQAGPGLAKLLAEQSMTILPGVPTLFGGLVKMLRYRPTALPQLRQLTNTGDHLPRVVVDSLQDLLPNAEVYPMYGLTECKRVSILLPSEIDRKRDSVGRALDGTEVFAVDGEGRRMPSGVTGEWVVRGPHVSPGYWRAPEETAKRFRPCPETGDTLLFTGDQGHVDAEGYLFFHARSDFMIKHKGHRLSPVEIEEAACSLPEVTTAGCVKDEAADQLCLFVGTGGRSLDPATVSETLRTVLEPVKVPDRVVVWEELPRTANQKVDRKALRQWLAQPE
jgi:acyl-coenzyme A synthetase/AMP-(fatty) acid ligase